jgi:hypothetical protein
LIEKVFIYSTLCLGVEYAIWEEVEAVEEEGDPQA